MLCMHCLLAAALGAHRPKAMGGLEVRERAAAPDRAMRAIRDNPEEPIQRLVVPSPPSRGPAGVPQPGGGGVVPGR